MVLAMVFESKKALREWLNDKRKNSEGPEQFEAWLQELFDNGNQIFVKDEEYDIWDCREML